MKQILSILKSITKYLNFAKVGWSKGGFRHIQIYISGLIALNKKTIRQISLASCDEKHHSQIHYFLQYAQFEQEKLSAQYLKKLKYLFKSLEAILIFDDTLVLREGEKIEETQYHKDHQSNSFLKGHQFFTSMILFGVQSFPLFPRLYSKNTLTKIEMARELIKNTNSIIPIDTVVCDSWYSDKLLMQICRKNNIRFISAVKSNRCIKFSQRGKFYKISNFSKTIEPKNEYKIDDINYKIEEFNIHIKKIYNLKLLISNELNKNKVWSNNFHILTTNKNDSIEFIISTYNKRWLIETYHRDIKQNLGFNKCQMRKIKGIICHVILTCLAYASLKLFMYFNKIQLTIGECIYLIQNIEFDEILKKIVMEDSLDERINLAKNLFKSEFKKV